MNAAKFKGWATAARLVVSISLVWVGVITAFAATVTGLALVFTGPPDRAMLPIGIGLAGILAAILGLLMSILGDLNIFKETNGGDV